MRTARLKVCQTVDRGRGSFFVNPLPVGKKKIDGEQVYRGSNERRTQRGQAVPHQMAIEFVVV